MANAYTQTYNPKTDLPDMLDLGLDILETRLAHQTEFSPFS
jgi:hypothetical protein